MLDIYTNASEVIYYDCTNFYFEIEAPEDDKQNGVSKEDGNRDFITTQSVKKLKKTYKDWALSSERWFCFGDEKYLRGNEKSAGVTCSGKNL